MPGPSITQFYGKDHDEIDGCLRSFQTQKHADYEKAKEAFKQFKATLQRHIVWEEDLLFPVWEKKSGMRHSGPTSVMRDEHRQIAERLESIHKKVQADNLNSVAEEQALIVLLSSHNMKEERVLYPSIDKLISDEERDDLYEKMKFIPQEHCRVCCALEHG